MQNIKSNMILLIFRLIQFTHLCSYYLQKKLCYTKISNIQEIRINHKNNEATGKTS